MIETLRSFIINHKLASIIIAGTLVRLILIPIFAHPFDVYAWYSLSQDILKNPTFNIYNFPPLWYHYIMTPIAYFYDWLSNIFSTGAIPMASLPSALNFYPSWDVQYVPGILFNSVAKIPFLFSDIAITVLLYKIIQEWKNKELAAKAALLWFINPFVIWISAAWGMWDTLPALFSLASIFFLLRKRITLSAVCLSLGVAAKIYPILFLIPIAIYISKTNKPEIKRRVLMKFLTTFMAVSILIFLPYFGIIANIITGKVTPGFAASGITFNPVVEPVGFGLTYWSLNLLNRLFYLPEAEVLASYASVVSIALVAASLAITYWVIYRMKFQKPTVDLPLVMLLPVLALFLSYRVICEQWFVWAIPLLIILWAQGQVKAAYYWAASFVALLYAVLNCPLPFFFLPLAPWYTDTLLEMVYAFWKIETLRVLLTVVLGIIFSILMVLILLKLAKPLFTNKRLKTSTGISEEIESSEL